MLTQEAQPHRKTLDLARALHSLRVCLYDEVSNPCAFRGHDLFTAPALLVLASPPFRILISTGSAPHRPSEISFDDVHTFDADTFLRMDRIPKSLAVIGGGVIGCEYASIFMALGVKVTLVDSRDRLLPFLDAEISDRLRDRLKEL